MYKYDMHIDNMKSGVWVINIYIHPAGGLTLAKMSWKKNWKPLCAKIAHSQLIAWINNDRPYLIYSRYKCAKQATSADVVERVHLIDVQTYCIEEKKQHQKRKISVVAHINHRTIFLWHFNVHMAHITRSKYG